MSTHHHVFAIQGWDDLRGYSRGWDGRLTRAEAEKLADELADAHRLMCIEWPRLDLVKAKYGDRLDELLPERGEWDDVWIFECGDPCQFEETLDQGPPGWGVPHWTRPDPDVIDATPVRPRLQLVTEE